MARFAATPSLFLILPRKKTCQFSHPVALVSLGHDLTLERWCTYSFPLVFLVVTSARQIGTITVLDVQRNETSGQAK